MWVITVPQSHSLHHATKAMHLAEDGALGETAIIGIEEMIGIEETIGIEEAGHVLVRMVPCQETDLALRTSTHLWEVMEFWHSD